MSIIIEKAVPSDAADILEYLKQVGGETDNLTFGAEGLPISVEAEEKFIASFENSSDSIMLLAKENGVIVGDASLTRMPRRMSHRGDFGICVLKSHWGRGIARKLMDGIVAFAKENELEIIDLQVRSDNLRAIALYETYGFKKLCTYPHFFKINGEYVDFDYMCLSLK